MEHPSVIKEQIREFRKRRGDTEVNWATKPSDIDAKIQKERERLEELHAEEERKRLEREAKNPARQIEERIAELEQQKDAERRDEGLKLMQSLVTRLIELSPRVDSLRAESQVVLDEIAAKTEMLWRLNEELGKPIKVLLQEHEHYIRCPAHHRANFPSGRTFQELMRERYGSLLNGRERVVNLETSDEREIVARPARD